MNELMQAELLKLSTTSTYRRLVAVFAGLVVLSTSLSVVVLGRQGEIGPDGNMVAVITMVGLSSTLLLLLGVMVTASETHHGVLTQTYLVTPARGRVLVAKLGAVALAGVVLHLGLTLLAIATASVQLSTRGMSLDLARIAVFESVAGSAAVAVLLGILGAAVGALVGNQTAALILVMTWSTVGEVILGLSVGPEKAKWLPMRAAHAVSEQTPYSLSVWVALVVALGYVAVLTVSAFRLRLPRDVA